MTVKKIAFFGIVLASIFVINSFVHSIYNLWQKNDLVVKATQDLEQEKKKNTKLKKKLATVKQPQFVEEEARNKLFLAKPGEGVIMIPAEYQHASPSAVSTLPDMRPNWQKWWKTFF